MNLLKLIAFLALSLTMVNCTQTLWLGENYQDLRSDIDTVSIVFPQIEYSVKNVNTKSPKTGYSVHVSNNVAKAVKEIIDEDGNAWKSSVIVYDSVMIGQWLIDNVYKSTGNFKLIGDSLQVTEDGKKILPITPELRSLMKNVKTRYFVFIRGAAYRSSNDAIRSDAHQSESFKLFFDQPFDYKYQWCGTTLEITLVDARSNEIMWYNFNEYNDSEYDPFDKAAVKKLCRKLLESI